jgi:hypothetical protein
MDWQQELSFADADGVVVVANLFCPWEVHRQMARFHFDAQHRPVSHRPRSSIWRDRLTTLMVSGVLMVDLEVIYVGVAATAARPRDGGTRPEPDENRFISTVPNSR